MKSYYFCLEERCGERSYTYDNLIYAKDHDDAYRIAQEYASGFYGDGGVQTEEYRWEFDFGAIAVEIDTVREMTESDYAKMMFSKSVLNPHGVKIPECIHFNA